MDVLEQLHSKLVILPIHYRNAVNSSSTQQIAILPTDFREAVGRLCSKLTVPSTHCRDAVRPVMQ